MYIRDVMTTNVVSIPSTTSLTDARRIMDAHRIRRLPVIDKAKPVGMVSRDALDKAGPSKLTTFSVHELSYLLSKITVKDVMKTDLVMVPPDATIEESVALAQSRHVGALLVQEEGRVVGIATTNDIFYRIVNPMLGIDQPGIRLSIHRWDGISMLQKILGIINQFNAEMVTFYAMVHPDTKEHDFITHVRVSDPAGLMDELRKNGFEVHERAR